jgi:hypothetical protein
MAPVAVTTNKAEADPTSHERDNCDMEPYCDVYGKGKLKEERKGRRIAIGLKWRLQENSAKLRTMKWNDWFELLV